MAIALDLIIWNGIFFILNFVLAIPLLLDWIPVRLSAKEKLIYEQDFKLFFTKKHFKILINYAQIQTYYSPIELATKGNPITNFIFVHFVSKDSEVLVYK